MERIGTYGTPEGLRNERRIGAYETGIIMMKYNEVMIRKETEA